MGHRGHVRHVPGTDIPDALFDYFVGAPLKMQGHIEAERLDADFHPYRCSNGPDGLLLPWIAVWQFWHERPNVSTDRGPWVRPP